MTDTLTLTEQVQQIRDSGHVPRVHPNGFIQLDLEGETGNGRRLHVWRRDLPHQTHPTSIHDHVFHMHSQVLRGRLINLNHSFYKHNQGRYQMWSVEGSEVVDTGSRFALDQPQTYQVTAGMQYHVAVGTFHETVALEPSVTVCTMSRRIPGATPSILVPDGVADDFDRHAFDEDWLWQVIGDMIGGL